MTLRSPRSLWVLMLATTALVLTLTIYSFRLDLEWWYRLGYVAFSCLCPFGLAELATQRVELRSDHLSMVKDFRRQTFPRTEVEAVTWGKGAGVSIRLADGTWVKLPPVGKTSQGVTNTIRAWIKRTSKLESESR